MLTLYLEGKMQHFPPQTRLLPEKNFFFEMRLLAFRNDLKMAHLQQMLHVFERN